MRVHPSKYVRLGLFGAQVYREQVERYLKSVDARLRETLLTVEVGHIVTRIRGADDWTYETTPLISEIRW